MDMTNTPSPQLLHVFYTYMLCQLPIFLAVMLFLFLLVSIVQKQRLMGLLHEGFVIQEQLLDPVLRRVYAQRRFLRVGLGGLWILDGLLQAQPDMSSEFIPNIVNPIVSAQPAILNNLFEPFVVLWSQNPLQFDLLAIWIQVGLGLVLLFGGNSILMKIALWLSIGWGVAVWIMGEGFGGIFTGEATWLMGAPGSVLFYVVGAVFLILPVTAWKDQTVHRTLQWIMVILWLWAASIQAWPNSGFWTSQGLSSTTLTMAEMPQPGFLAHMLYGVVHVLDANPILWNSVFVIWMAVLGIGWIWRAKFPLVVPLTLLWLFVTWVIGQDFGVLGGLGTDPNSSPVVALLILAVYTRKHKLKGEPALMSTV